jgi:glucokinase
MSQSSGRAPFYVGIDVGGTNIKAGVVDDAGCSLSRVSVSTEAARGPQVGLENIARAAERAITESGLARSALRGVGLATPGTMDIPGGLLLDPPNLPGWTHFAIRDLLAQKLQLPTILQNDANAAAYGEFWAGGAKEARSLVFWTLGTGIGCGIILDDVILEGAHSHGAECGHTIIEMSGRRERGSDLHGTLEAYAGARALVARCEEALADGRESSIQAHLAAGAEITPVLIGQAAEAGDPLCYDLVLETARFMGVGTVTLMHTINPEMVLFGGAMTFGRTQSPLGRRFLEEIKAEVKKRAFPIPAARTVIEYASLGSDAGYIGAAGCARLKFGSPPGVVD